ncbi:flippase activity-associated protein Agl23 [Pelagicoccus sp. SDUM812002]|uniref:flippase activity-associated protein Agl23 n=1 Tax=Pelagicoccus sp. SDUM812002 TaxID=3041266 RepID=UPI00280FF5FC|nr:flippase activity-associated protein Agl23 [Pelagicoccus sp. SDUM812002]MDQ8186241.1 TIGR03663 family protein [Pelagicoccus sp. SDUM812002]
MLGLAFWLRNESSQLRLFHADEGVQSYQAWRLIETGDYRYDPSEHHGPLLYYVTKWMAPFLEDSSGALSDAGMRRVPLLFSLVTLVFGLSVFRRCGAGLALLWGLLFAAAPLNVIYGSYFVQEALLVCFTLAFLVAIHGYWQRPCWMWASVVGVTLGLMHVTKETVVLHVAAIGLALVLIAWIQKKSIPVALTAFFKHLGLAVGLALLMHCLFFSSFFRNPQGIVDGFATFFSYADRSQGQGHEKPFLYYLSLLLPQRLEGVRWGELAFLVAVVVGVIRSFRKVRENGFSAFVVLSGIIMIVVYSVIPYKNPWLLLGPYCLLSYAASFGVIDLFRMGIMESERVRKWSLYAAAAGVLLFLGFELRSNLNKAIYLYSSAARNPYLYMHTTPRYATLVERLNSVSESEGIAVYSPDASWPLPWHLRERERVGYWSDLENYKPRGIDLIDTRLLLGNESVMSDGAFWELHGLRPNTLLALRAEDGIAVKWINANAKD